MNKKLLISLVTGLAILFAHVSFAAVPATPYAGSAVKPTTKAMSMMSYGTAIYVDNNSPAIIQIHVPFTTYYKVLRPGEDWYVTNEGYYGPSSIELSDFISGRIFYFNDYVRYDGNLIVTVRNGIYFVDYYN